MLICWFVAHTENDSSGDGVSEPLPVLLGESLVSAQVQVFEDMQNFLPDNPHGVSQKAS